VKVFSLSYRKSGRKYLAYRERYESFHPDDWEHLCPGHHGQIHEVYDEIIMKWHRRKNGKPFFTYTWREARSISNLLKKSYLSWKAIPAVESNPHTERLGCP